MLIAFIYSHIGTIATTIGALFIVGAVLDIITSVRYRMRGIR